MNDQPADIGQIIREASETGVPSQSYALQNGYGKWLRYAELWEHPADLPEASDNHGDRAPIHDPGVYDDVVELMAQEVARVVQFPLDTTYMFGLGVVASALTLNATYRYYDSQKPVTLYIASAQPPSSGKSGVHGYFMRPVDQWFTEKNQQNAAARQSIKSDIAGCEAEMKKAADSTKLRIAEQIEALEQELAATPIYRWSPTDVTAEALAELALQQTGYFAINADETEAINTLLGATYGNSDSKKNYGVVLKGWDGERIETGRITRECSAGHVRGTLNILAQNETIETLLAAGSRGRGVSERFFIVREPTMRGKREFGVRQAVDEKIRTDYQQLIKNIFDAGEIVFTFSDVAEDLICQLQNDLEPKLAPDGEYAHDMISGFFGKADKHIRKLSCVLQAIKSFAPGGNGSLEVGSEAAQKAIRIFNAAGETYVNAADAMDYAGQATEFNAIVEGLKAQVRKKKLVIEIRTLRDAIKNRAAIKGVPELSKQLKEYYLPQLERNAYLLISGSKIIINPRIEG